MKHIVALVIAMTAAIGVAQTASAAEPAAPGHAHLTPVAHHRHHHHRHHHHHHPRAPHH